MERTATWENLGQNFNGELKSGIPSAMAFTVHKEPMGWVDADGNFHKVKNTSTVINDSTGKAYGPVADNYGAINNVDALGSLQYIEGLEIKKYGETRGGMQYIIGKLNDFNILGDTYSPYLIYRNSFNGSYPIQAAICPLRIVCQNQLNMSFANADNMFSIRHTSKASEKIKEAQEILLGTEQYIRELNKQAEKYATIKVSASEEQQIIRELFPLKDDMTDRQKNTIEARREAFINALHTEDVRNVKGTIWGLIMSYSDYVTHYNGKKTETAEENRFLSVTFDPRIMARFIELANSVVIAA